MKRIILLAITLCCVSVANLRAQFLEGMHGLLAMPSADFHEDATLSISNNYLNKNYLSPVGWGYDTFGYSFAVTLWGRLEIAYICTIFDGKRKPNGDSRDKIMFNQDRHFAAKVLVMKEGDYGVKWLPNIAIGASDPASGWQTDYTQSDLSRDSNAYFNKFYITANKYFNTAWGAVGGHVGYQYTLRKDYIRSGVLAAVTWDPVWLNREDWFMSGFRVTTEWDARYVNVGVNASIWKDRFELMAMLLGCRYPMVGLRFKLHMSH